MKKTIKTPIRVFVFLSLLLSITFLPIFSVSALPTRRLATFDTGDSNCFSLDVVFLIDQSGSMSSASKTLNPSDPSGLRVQAVKWVIDWLGDNILSNCPEAIHRLGVISWGTTAETDFVEEIQPKTWDEWGKERVALKNLVEVKNLGFTKPDLAFDTAKKEIFDQFETVSLGDLPRKRVIIFLTDGVPYPGVPRDWTEQIAADFPFDSVLLQQEDCFATALKNAQSSGQLTMSSEEKNYCLGNYLIGNSAYKNSTYIWSILLNANKDENMGVSYTDYASFYQDMERVSSSHAGEVTPIKNYIDIPTIFLHIMTTLAGTKAKPLNCGDFEMEPYLQQATLSFFKIDKDLPVEISYENNGQTYTITENDLLGKTVPVDFPGFKVKDYTTTSDSDTSAAIERYVFLKPYAGKWNISAPTTKNCEGIQASFEPLDIGVELKSPSPTVPQYDLDPYYDKSAPIYIEYQLVDRGVSSQEQEEKIMEPDSRFPLMVSATLINPAGKEEKFPLQYDSNKKTYISTAPLKVNIVGTYKLTTIFNINGSTRSLLSGETRFDVVPVSPFRILISEPQPKQVYSLHSGPTTNFRIKPIEFRVVLTDRDKNKIDPALIFLNPNLSLQGSVSSGNNKFPISFEIDPEHPDEFVGQISSFKDEGTYHLSVSVKDEEAYSAQYRPDNKTVEVDFILRDTLWTRPLTYKVLGIILLLFIIATIIAIAVSRNNPVTGTLVFEIGTTHIADIPIGTGWNVSKISRGTLQAYSSLGLRSLKAQKSKEQLGCVDYSAVDMNGNPYSGTLMPESTTPFAGGMTVRYDPLESQ